jgi:hypothetical protein
MAEKVRARAASEQADGVITFKLTTDQQIWEKQYLHASSLLSDAERLELLIYTEGPTYDRLTVTYRKAIAPEQHVDLEQLAAFGFQSRSDNPFRL